MEVDLRTPERETICLSSSTVSPEVVTVNADLSDLFVISSDPHPSDQPEVQPEIEISSSPWILKEISNVQLTPKRTLKRRADQESPIGVFKRAKRVLGTHEFKTLGRETQLGRLGQEPIGTQPVGTQPVGTQPLGTQPRKQPKAKIKCIKKMTDRKETVRKMHCLLTGNTHTLALASESLTSIGCTVKTSGITTEKVELIVQMAHHVTDKFCENQQLFIECEPHIVSENVRILLLNTDLFLDMVCAPKEDQTAYFEECTSLSPGRHIYIVQGLEKAQRKLLNNYNREIQRRARAMLDGRPTTINDSPKEDLERYNRIQAALASLEVMHAKQIFYTASDSETAHWIAAFVQDLSLARYTAHYPQHPKVKGFADPIDIYCNSILNVRSLTLQTARRLHAYAPSLGSLANELREDRNALHKKGLVSSAVSCALYNLFWSQDPNSIM